MAKPPKPKIVSRRDSFHTVWKELAATETFAEMSLEQFKDATESPVTVRERIETAKAQLSALMRERGLADKELRKTLSLVINSVRGNPQHGEDSPLYRALGYVPKSERESGLSRKAAKLGKTAGLPNANAA